MSDFIVAPGEIIKEYLDARGLTQKEVSKRTGVSERHLSQLLNGKTRLTEDMALKLEKVMPDVPASFWLNYEVKYQEYLAREREEAHLEELDLKEIAKRFHFKEAFGRVGGMSLVEQAIAMLKILGITDFDRYGNAVPDESSSCKMVAIPKPLWFGWGSAKKRLRSRTTLRTLPNTPRRILSMPSPI